MAKKIFSAMLAESPSEDMNELRYSKYYPMYSSFKLDGIRGISRNGGVVSRSDKLLPSGYVQRRYSAASLSGIDGELVVSNIRPGMVFKDSFSAVMTHGADIPLDWFVFDDCSDPSKPFELRYEQLRERVVAIADPKIHVIEQRLVRNFDDVLTHEKEALDLGYEGLCVRRRDAPYKYGRSTLVQQWLLKVVRVKYSEFVIDSCYEGLQNNNEPVIDSRGYTTRSKHLDQMVGKGALGGFSGHDLHTGCKFNIGVIDGLDQATRQYIWEHQEEFIGRITRYRYKPYGMDVAPRQPVIAWGEWRDPMDL